MVKPRAGPWTSPLRTPLRILRDYRATTIEDTGGQGDLEDRGRPGGRGRYRRWVTAVTNNTVEDDQEIVLSQQGTEERGNPPVKRELSSKGIDRFLPRWGRNVDSASSSSAVFPDGYLRRCREDTSATPAGRSRPLTTTPRSTDRLRAASGGWMGGGERRTRPTVARMAELPCGCP